MNRALVASRPRQLGFRGPFALVLAGETLSALGSMLSSFAMGISVYQASGRMLDFAVMGAAVLLPAALLAPWTGAVADGVDRRWLICVCDALTALCTLALAALVWSGAWAMWQVALLACIGACAQAFQGPASQALCAALFAPGESVRMAGWMGLSSNAVRLASPFCAAVLLERWGLATIVCIDLVTFVLGTALVLYALRDMPRQHARCTLRNLMPGRAIAQILGLLGEVARSRAMALLLAYSTLQSAMFGTALYMLTPLVLARHGTAELPLAMVAGAAGALAGSACLAFAGSCRNAIAAIVGCDVLAAICVMAVGAGESMPVVTGGIFVAQACSAIAAGLTTSLWVRFMPAAQWGRMFATLAMLASLAVPLGTLAGSSMLDADGAMRSSAVQSLFMACGALALATALVFALASKACGARPAVGPSGG